MKNFSVLALVFALTATVFAGCRNTTNTTTTTLPATSAATQTTMIPSPDITLPLDTSAAEDTSLPPAARAPRY